MEYSIQEFSISGQKNLWLIPGLNYGMLFTVNGSAELQTAEGIKKVGESEILVCRPGSSTVLDYDEKPDIKLVWLIMPPELMDELSGSGSNVRRAFERLHSRVSLISPDADKLMLMKELIEQLRSIKQQRGSFYADLLEEGEMKMFIALLLRSFS